MAETSGRIEQETGGGDPAGGGMGRVVECPVEVPADGIVTVAHDLGTVDVRVTCLGPDGSPVGYLAAVPIDTGRVEVVTAAGTQVAAVRVATAV